MSTSTEMKDSFRVADHAIRVGFDGRAISERRTGVGRYVGDLISTAARLGAPDVRFTAVLFRTRNGPPPDLQDLKEANVSLRALPWSLDKLFYVGTRLLLPVPFEVVAPAQDIMLFPNYRRYSTLGKPVVSVIYDLSYLVTPESVHPRFIRQLRHIAPKAIRTSDVVITISQTMAGEIAAAYPEAASRLRVIPPGVPRGLSLEPPRHWRERLSRFGLEPGYFLHVGTIEPRKNLRTLVAAHGRLPPAVVSRHPLVLVGPRGWRDGPIMAAIDSAGDRVRRLSYLSDPDLRSVYEGALAFVYPTLYEGFGLPLLEAMALGLPVACSDIPVLREVGGRAPVYFDHLDPDAIAGAIAALIEDPALRRDAADRGRRQAAGYSWESSARELLGVIMDLAAGVPRPLRT